MNGSPSPVVLVCIVVSPTRQNQRAEKSSPGIRILLSVNAAGKEKCNNRQNDKKNNVSAVHKTKLLCFRHTCSNSGSLNLKENTKKYNAIKNYLTNIEHIFLTRNKKSSPKKLRLLS